MATSVSTGPADWGRGDGGIRRADVDDLSPVGGAPCSTGTAPRPYTVPVRSALGVVERFNSTADGRPSLSVAPVSRETWPVPTWPGPNSSCLPVSRTVSIPSVSDRCPPPAPASWPSDDACGSTEKGWGGGPGAPRRFGSRRSDARPAYGARPNEATGLP